MPVNVEKLMKISGMKNWTRRYTQASTSEKRTYGINSNMFGSEFRGESFRSLLDLLESVVA